MSNKKIEKANLKVQSALGVFRKAHSKVSKAIEKLEGVVSNSEVNVAELNERIRDEQTIIDSANSHIKQHKETLEKFSKFLP